MYKNNKIIAIIPARGGSKGIHHKNIVLLAGKPLIAYTIEEAKKSKYIDKIIVSTDDNDISKISKLYGAEVDIRPTELSKDSTPTLHVLQYLIKKFDNKFNPDIVILLQPTSPLRKSMCIDSSIEKLLKTNCDSVISVSSLKYNPVTIVSVDDDILKMNAIDLSNLRRQDSNLYHINGAVYVIKKDILMKQKEYLLGKDNRVIMMSEEDSIDIDTPLDLDLAELQLKKTSNKQISIGRQAIGEDYPCFIIAEAGVNHNGSLELAKKLVDAAKQAGADAVKFQTFESENLVSKTTVMAEYQKKNIGRIQSQFEMLKKLELSHEDFIELKDYCDKKGIIFLSTPHTDKAADFLEDLMPFFKLGSGDLTNIPFLERVAKKNKPIILSTGMGTLEEIEEAFNTIKKYNNQIILLHCTTSYPCPREEVNLKVINTLKDKFNVLVGYSDHTEGIDIPLMAASLGAVVIEKHITLDKKMPGPDHKSSLNPKELEEMIYSIRDKKVIKIPKEILGTGIKKPTENELEIAKLVRKSIIAAKNISANTKLTEDMLVIKRPGTGIPPKELKNLIGKTAKKQIKKDRLIKPSDIKFIMPKIFVASFNRASDGALSLLLKKMKKENMFTNDYKNADFILAVGDRVETFDFVLKRFQENKRIIHLWAGEISQGTHDEVYRHAMTIMSEIHLCTNPEAEKRVIELCKSIDKQPETYVIGNLMLDNLESDKSKVPKTPYDLVLYNPPTSLSKKEISKEIEQIKILLNKKYIWIEPNGDFGSELIKNYVTHSNLPRSEFLGLMKSCDRFITNSSCMYYEAPFLLRPEQIISIGERNINRESKFANMKIKNASDNIIRILKELK